MDIEEIKKHNEEVEQKVYEQMCATCIDAKKCHDNCTTCQAYKDRVNINQIRWASDRTVED